MCCCKLYKKNSAQRVLTLCVLILALSGCVSSVVQTRALLPAPRTPGAVVTDEYICIPTAEAAELLLWVENVEAWHD